MSININGQTVTGDLVNDEQAGAQNTGDEIAALPDFTNNTLDIYFTSLAVAPAVGFPQYARDTLTGFGTTIQNLSLSSDTAGTAFNGQDSGLMTADNQPIFLFSDASNNVALGRVGGPGGPIAFAIAIDEGVIGGFVSAATLNFIQYLPLEHSGLGQIGSADVLSLSNKLFVTGSGSVTQTVTTGFNVAGAPSGNNDFVVLAGGDTPPNGSGVAARGLLLTAGEFGDATQQVNISTQGIGVDNNAINLNEEEYVRVDFVTNLTTGADGGNGGSFGATLNFDSHQTDVTGLSFIVQRVDGNSTTPVDVQIEAQNVVAGEDNLDGSNFLNTLNAGSTNAVNITGLKIYNAAGTLIEAWVNGARTLDSSAITIRSGDGGPVLTTGLNNPIVELSGLLQGYKVEFTTALAIDRAVIKNTGDSGSDDDDFTIGSLSSIRTVTQTSTSVVSAEVGSAVKIYDDGPSLTLTGVNGPTLTVDDDTVSSDAGGDFSGQFTLNFGADGAGTKEYGLGVGDGSTGLMAFDENGVKQAVVLSVDQKGVIHGTAGTKDIFRVSVDANGLVTLDQKAPILHLAGTDTATLPSNLINLTLRVTDGDGDAKFMSTGIGNKLVFNDSQPSVSVSGSQTFAVDESDFSTNAVSSINGAFNVNFGADGAGAQVYSLSVTDGTATGLTDSLTGDPVLVYLENGQVVGRAGGANGPISFVVSIDGSGLVTLDGQRGVIHSPNGGPNDGATILQNVITAKLTVTDADGDTASATLDLGQSLSFGDDAPSISADPLKAETITVDESNLAANGTGSVAAAFSFNPGADGTAQIIYNIRVGINEGGNSGLDNVATGNNILLYTVNGVVEGRDEVTNDLIFTVSIDQTGTVTLDQIGAVKHPNGTDPNDAVTMAANRISVVGIVRDKDLDLNGTTISIGDKLVFKDNGPSVTLTEAQPAALAVYESDLNTDATAEIGGPFEALGGADGLKSVAFSLEVTDGQQSNLITTDGTPIYLWKVGNTVEGHAGDVNSPLAFVISLDGSTIKLDQKLALKHPDGSNANDSVSLTTGLVQVKATATDNDNDTATSTANVDVSFSFADDRPTVSLQIPNASASFTDGDFALGTPLNLNLANQFVSSFGADGAGTRAYSLQFVNGSDSGIVDVGTGLPVLLFNESGNLVARAGAADGPVVITFTLAQDGTVEMIQLRPVDHTGDADNVVGFNIGLKLTVTDADGDAKSTTLPILIQTQDGNPSITLQGNGLENIVVDETTMGQPASHDYSGVFNTSFGPDGAGTKVFSLEAPAGGVDSTLIDTASGNKIFVFFENGKAVGRAGTDAADAVDNPASFEVTVDAQAGVVTLKQFLAIKHPFTNDHDEATAFAGLLDGKLNLKVTVTDKDGDTVSAAVDIMGSLLFKDDGPSISADATKAPVITLDESDLAADGEGSFSTAFEALGGADGLKSVAYALGIESNGADSGLVHISTGNAIKLYIEQGVVVGRDAVTNQAVFQVTVDGTGKVVLNQLDAVKHSDASNPNDTVSTLGGKITLTGTAMDGDGDTAGVVLNIGDKLVFQDDAPEILSGSVNVVGDLTVVETTLGTGAATNWSAIFLVKPGADGIDTASIKWGFQFEEGADSGLIDSNTGDKVMLYHDGNKVVGKAGSLVVFTMSVDSQGHLSMVQDRAVIHDPNLGPNDVASIVGGVLKLGLTISDKDGDSDSEGIDIGAKIKFVDDAPFVEASYVLQGVLVVDESNLGQNDTDPFATAFIVKPSTDGTALSSFSLGTVDGTNSGLVDAATGKDVLLYKVGETIVGRVEGSNETVFVLSVDADQGEVTLDQQRAIVHDQNLGPNDQEFLANGSVKLSFSITDKDGDTASKSVDITSNIKFLDDAPSFGAASQVSGVTVDESNLGKAASADLSGLFNANYGADGAGSLAYTLKLAAGPSGLVDTATGEAVVLSLDWNVITGKAGANGPTVFTITLGAAGMVTLEQARTVMHPDGSNPGDGVSLLSNLISISATITDKDGDTVCQDVDITSKFTFKDDGPCVEVTGQPKEIIDDESDLSIDNSFDFSSIIHVKYGADGAGKTEFSFKAKEGCDTGLVDTQTGEAVILCNVDGKVLGKAGDKVVFVLSITAAGVVTLDQMRAVVHSDPERRNELSDWLKDGLIGINVKVTDKDGDSAVECMDISKLLAFRDDGPALYADAAAACSLVVDETNLNQDDSFDFSGLFHANYGADGSGEIDGYCLELDEEGVDSGIIDVATGTAVLLYTYQGKVLGTAGAGGPTVLEISTDSEGNVTLDQRRALKHGNAGNPDDAVTFWGEGLVYLKATATDGDGDTGSARSDITKAFVFEDDGPQFGSIEGSSVAYKSGKSVAKTFWSDKGADGGDGLKIKDFTNLSAFTETLSSDGKTLVYSDAKGAAFRLTVSDTGYKFDVLRDGVTYARGDVKSVNLSGITASKEVWRLKTTDKSSTLTMDGLVFKSNSPLSAKNDLGSKSTADDLYIKYGLVGVKGGPDTAFNKGEGFSAKLDTGKEIFSLKFDLLANPGTSKVVVEYWLIDDGKATKYAKTVNVNSKTGTTLELKEKDGDGFDMAFVKFSSFTDAPGGCEGGVLVKNIKENEYVGAKIKPMDLAFNLSNVDKDGDTAYSNHFKVHIDQWTSLA